MAGMYPHLQAGMRVIKARRISRDTETSSALDRQDIDLDAALAGTGTVVVANIVDATVSGAINLPDRKSLGRWMKEPLWFEWDAIVVTCLDRITRDKWHWEQFAEKCHQGGKEIICLDDPSLDIHTTDGRTIAYLKAAQAQKFREAISAKRLNQTSHYRQVDLWGGGAWPFGYRPVPVEQEDGKLRYKLFHDPTTAPLVREAYKRIVDQGHSMGMICRDWNDRGVLTSKDHQRFVNASEKKAGTKIKVKGSVWASSALGAILRKPTLKGIAMHKGEPLLKGGLPVRWAEPILTDEEYESLQKVLEGFKQTKSGVRRNSDPLGGVFQCPCGVRLYLDKRTNKTVRGGVVVGTRTSHYDRCGSRILSGKACGFQASWKRELLLSELESGFLDRIGDKEVMERSWVPGTDHRKQIKELKAANENLLTAIKAAKNPAVITSLVESQEENATLLAQLEAEPFKPGYWAEHGTGKTYRQEWERMGSWDQRGPFLYRAGFRMIPLSVEGSEPAFILVAPGDAGKENEEFTSKEYDQSVHEYVVALMKKLAEEHEQWEEAKMDRHRDDY
ncbi:recombinase family protein [Streptomyces albidoflavus]|uniref:recombinase family protein n=1 Tax=Streptomyces albidoflavus TaxID=1886 RepID=UPI003402A973